MVIAACSHGYRSITSLQECQIVTGVSHCYRSIRWLQECPWLQGCQMVTGVSDGYRSQMVTGVSGLSDGYKSITQLQECHMVTGMSHGYRSAIWLLGYYMVARDVTWLLVQTVITRCMKMVTGRCHNNHFDKIPGVLDQFYSIRMRSMDNIHSIHLSQYRTQQCVTVSLHPPHSLVIIQNSNVHQSRYIHPIQLSPYRTAMCTSLVTSTPFSCLNTEQQCAPVSLHPPHSAVFIQNSNVHQSRYIHPIQLSSYRTAMCTSLVTSTPFSCLHTEQQCAPVSLDPPHSAVFIVNSNVHQSRYIHPIQLSSY